MNLIQQEIESARDGTHPRLICKMPAGWVVLCERQHLPGYSILLPDPIAGSINELSRERRATYLCDMITVGDALLDVTDAFRINYAILGNSNPALHAHIVPRYLSEPEEIRHSLPWSYPKEILGTRLFDHERDKELIGRLAKAIAKRL
jgi:diadenosine tetraphosphate (Ap4A) HIT family hydrolase